MRAFQPLHDRVFVRRLETETETAGGILLPAQSQKRNQEAVVIAVGPGKPLTGGAALEELAKGVRPDAVDMLDATTQGDEPLWSARTATFEESGETPDAARLALAARLAATALALVSSVRRQPAVKPGDKVLIPKYGEMLFVMGEDGSDQASRTSKGGDCVMLMEKDIVAVLE